jgi:bacillithiol biosynthesis cysteine-adding enzyme BshC
MRGLRIEPEVLAAPGGIVSKILGGAPNVARLFAAGAFEPIGERAAAERLSVSRLSAEAFHCPGPAGPGRLRAALSGKGLVVTTGQQPQLFGGPLYVLYKALTAARLASNIEGRTGIPCLAVFWVAADDHDWREVASLGFLDREERPGRLEVAPPPERVRRSVGPSALPNDIGAYVDSFIQSVAVGDAGGGWPEMLRREYTAGRSFTEAFVGLASCWTRDLPIAFLDAAHPVVRQASAPLVDRVLAERVRLDEAIGRGVEAVVDLGYRPQLAHAPAAIPVFRDGPDGRYRLRGDSGPIQVDARGGQLPVEALRDELKSRPDRFSPSAALRPALESWLIPVAATVLGPGELAYWAQLRPLFDTLEIPMPRVVPRDSWRVVEPRIARLLEKTGVTADDLRDGGTSAAAGRVEQSRPRAVEEALLHLEDNVSARFQSLEETIASDLPGLRSAVGKSRSQVFSALASFHKTLDGVIRDRERATLSQLHRAALHLYPDGTPQERAYGAMGYLCQLGDGLLDSLRAAADIGDRDDGTAHSNGVAGASTWE